MSRYKDFDKFFEEHKKEPVKFKMFGEVHELPSSLPASIMLQLQSIMDERGADAEPNEQEAINMMYSVIGKGKFEELCDEGMDIDQMWELFDWVMQQYGIGEEEIEEAKKKMEKK